MPAWFYTLRCAPLEMISSKSLWIFLLHQPILIALLGFVKDLLA